MKMSSNKQLAVVIGFRDWGLDRLGVAVKQIAKSSIAKELDIVVSDYGSEDEVAVRRTVEHAGGRVVRSPRSGPWSRSRALNAGVRGTSARYLITTDADMIFSPRAAEVLLGFLRSVPDTVHLVQCRDLSQEYGADRAAEGTAAEFEENSFFRPRWGMGGLVAFQRKDFDLIGGYDERMEIYGGEDIDFAQRLTRSGLRLNWVDDRDVRIYHIWHPSTREAVMQVPAELKAQQKNRDIMLNDPSWVRNLNIGNKAAPVASVLIATHNRAGYLRDAINSALSQTIQDIEVVVMDDGSTDETPEVLSELKDPRVRVLRQEASGVAAARNRLVDEARSPFLVVHDDDDIMLPWRVEAHFSALECGVVATYGGWVDFDNETGQTAIVQGREYNAEAFMFAGRVLAHGTTMFRKEVLQRYRYREYLKSGVDFNLITRMAAAGFLFKHTGHLHIMRRMHDMNLTRTNQAHQKRAATRTTTLLQQRNSQARGQELRAVAKELKVVRCLNVLEFSDRVLPFLPDHLGRRSAAVTHFDNTLLNKVRSFFKPEQIHPIGTWKGNTSLEINDITLADYAWLQEHSGGVAEVGPLREHCRSDHDSSMMVQDILAALPDSDLLDPEKITVLHLGAQVPAGSSPEQDSLATKRRIWSDSIVERVVETWTINTLDELSNVGKPHDQGDIYVVMPDGQEISSWKEKRK